MHFTLYLECHIQLLPPAHSLPSLDQKSEALWNKHELFHEKSTQGKGQLLFKSESERGIPRRKGKEETEVGRSQDVREKRHLHGITPFSSTSGSSDKHSGVQSRGSCCLGKENVSRLLRNNNGYVRYCILQEIVLEYKEQSKCKLYFHVAFILAALNRIGRHIKFYLQEKPYYELCREEVR